MKSIPILAALIITVLTAVFIGEKHVTAQLPEFSSDTSTATTTTGDGLEPRVTKLVRLSASGLACSLIDEWGPHMAVDPANPKHLAVIYQLGDVHDINNVPQVAVVASSFDGGSTWTQAMLPGMTLCSNGPNGVVGDPYIAIGSAGNVAATETWQSWDPFPTDSSDARLFVSHSSNKFAFGAPVQPELTVNPNANQRGPVLFDPQVSNHLLVEFERIHYLNTGPIPSGNVIFGLGGSVAVAQSFNGGETFAIPAVNAVITPPGEEAVSVGLLKSGNDLVAIAGVVSDTDVLTLPRPERLVAVRSSDGGATFGSPAPVVTWTSEGLVANNATAFVGTYNFNPALNGCCIPHAAAGPGNSLYVTWTDAATNGVFLARSNDGGRSWTGANLPAITTENGVEESAVAARSDGAVALFYYAISPDATLPNHNILTPYVAVSKDGISGWKAIAIAKPFDLSLLTGGTFDGPTPIGPGPYQDIVALPDGFGVALTLNDQNDPTQEHVYYAKVNVK